MTRYLFTFLFHPATRWTEPYPCEEIIETPTEAAAWEAFWSIWYRNTSNEKCRAL